MVRVAFSLILPARTGSREAMLRGGDGLKALCLFLLLSLLLLASCGKSLDRTAASRLAASLANEECRRLYHRAPFSSDDYDAQVIRGRWSWGRLDPAGKEGFSAEVSFKRNGSDTRVVVYYSSDILRSRPGWKEREESPARLNGDKRIGQNGVLRMP